MPTPIGTAAYNRAVQTLKKRYEKEYYAYRDSDACWGTTYTQRHQSALRYLRFRHPVVFKRLYKSFRQVLESV
jgi:hypothetical protein